MTVARKTYLRPRFGKHDVVYGLVEVSWELVEFWGRQRTDAFVLREYAAFPALPYCVQDESEAIP